MPGRVLGPESGKGGEGWREPGRGWVGVWGGAGDPEGGQTSPVPAIRDDRGKASFTGQDRGRCGEEIVRCPSLHPVPEAIHCSEGGGVWGKEVGPVGKYREEEAMRDAMA